jgi:hypothetical protein
MSVVTQIQVRRGTASQWTSADTTLASGEWGFETDTGKVKIGDGTTAWTSLGYTGAGDVTLTGTQTLTNKTLTAPVINLALNPQTGTTYTFALTDNGKLVTASNAGAQTYSIPTNASVAFPTGTQINIIGIDAGVVTIQATTSGTTTVASTGTVATAPTLRAQYSSATLIKVATDVWYVIGDIA